MTEDLMLESRFFQAISRLRAASSWLERIANQQKPDNNGKVVLEWTGRFLSEVNWPFGRERTGEQESAGGGLAVQATSIRPMYYSSLLRFEPVMKAAGETQAELFLSKLFALLISGGSETQLAPEKIKLGSTLLLEIANSIFLQLTNNGLPSPPIFEYTA